MLKGYVSYEIYSEELFDSKYPPERLLIYVIKELKNRGLICDSINIGPCVFYTHCNTGDNKVRIEIFPIHKKVDSVGGVVMVITKVFPWWKKIFFPKDLLPSEKDFQNVCDKVDEILRSDPRVKNIKWD
jgi:hypothetical protein